MDIFSLAFETLKMEYSRVFDGWYRCRNANYWGGSIDLTTLRMCFTRVYSLQGLYPGDPYVELRRSLYLDTLRWYPLFRMGLSSSKKDSFIMCLKQWMGFFSGPEYNPYCQYSMSFGLTCRGCPLVTYGLVTLPEKDITLVDSSYLGCYLYDRKTLDLVELVQALDRSAPRSKSVEVLRAVGRIFDIAADEVTDGYAVQLYSGVFGFEPYKGVCRPRKKKPIDSPTEEYLQT